ncbi:peptidoglycan-binding domain-containing protein [Nocardioides flavescens]|uniref:Peptidoglycan binding-like domain-containing protein n=1 Tax=Nocardioides flavescens TaxID=2691959 RepID=A0A6L7EQN9_9ACTN|nr:peptidoglycan-binding domain-containing protein [Nocardioides flavescens]MXG88940.1 hypothetical protein [Nocardioides flavescens]
MRLRLVAPLVAGLLGIVGGVTTAVVTAAPEDPLGLGVALRDVSCTGQAVSVLASGASVAGLRNAVVNASAANGPVHYLRTADSCATSWTGDNSSATAAGERPDYVVYQGPYATPREPCGTRMKGAARRGGVVLLREGAEVVQCLCELPDTDGPELSVGTEETAESRAWVRLLQVMLNDEDPEDFPRRAITGEYDATTAAVVSTYQDRAPGQVTEDGVVDTTTWRILAGRLCS